MQFSCMKMDFIIQCTPDISWLCISWNWIYCCHMLDPISLPTFFREILQTWRPKAWYILQNRGNSWDPIRGRQFFAESAHCDSLCSCWQETIFREIDSSLPGYAGWNTCCATVSHARWRPQSIDTSIVLQSTVQLIQCGCKLWLRTDTIWA